MSKKKILIVALIVLLIAAIGVGSLAWYNATKTVTNTFKTAKDGGGSGGGSDFFSIALTETSTWTDKTGDGTTGFTYNKVLPGSVVSKVPTVKNTGIYDQWVKVKVIFDKADVWSEVTGNDLTKLQGYIQGVPSDWTYKGYKVADGKVYLTYALNAKLDAANEETSTPAGEKTVFTSVKIDENITTEQMVALTGGDGGAGFNVSVVAYALQYDNNPDQAGWPEEVTSTDP